MLASSHIPRLGPALTAAGALLKRLLYVAFVLALVLVAIALAAAAMPRLFGLETLAVTGRSMGDSLPLGTMVVARSLDPQDVRVGDIIVLRSDGRSPVIHRVISLDEENGQILAQTKGDANPAPDPGVYVLEDRVRVPAYTVPYLGYVVSFVSTPLGWALAVALPAAILCLFVIRTIWREERRAAARTPEAS